jgi:dienelactone hydrolase
MDPRFEDVAPAVFLAAVNDARAVTRVDSNRIYLFGNSMGGYLAFDGAFLEPERFAAAAIHGMNLADEYTWILDRATRKTPIALYIGDQDSFHSLREVRKTRDLLVKRGFPVRYVELERHGHNYYELSERINADAWSFFSGVTLPSVPSPPAGAPNSEAESPPHPVFSPKLAGSAFPKMISGMGCSAGSAVRSAPTFAVNRTPRFTLRYSFRGMSYSRIDVPTLS